MGLYKYSSRKNVDFDAVCSVQIGKTFYLQNINEFRLRKRNYIFVVKVEENGTKSSNCREKRNMPFLRLCSPRVYHVWTMSETDTV